jgi:hypothetical protein
MQAALVVVLGVLAVVATSAQGQPVGPRIQANQFVVGNQGSRMSCGYYERRGQDVAADALGNFVVVWQSGDYYDTDIVARRYNRYGIEEGDEFRVNSITQGHQKTPTVAMDTAGDFVIAWNSYGSQSAYPSEYYSDIFARRFGANGAPKGPDFKVSDNAFTINYGGGYTYTLYHYAKIRNPNVDTGPAGRFIVVWQRDGYDPDFLGDDDQRQVVGNRFDAGGASEGKFKINDGTTGSLYWNEMPDVAHDGSGNFVVTWKAINGYYGGESVVARRFDSAGDPVGGEFEVSDASIGQNYFESTPAVETDAGGGFLVVWGSSSLDAESGDNLDVAARRFDSAGVPQTPTFRVNTGTAGAQCGPAIARLGGGDFVVTWHHSYPPPYGIGYGQRLTATGTPVGGEFDIDPGEYVTTTAIAPTVGNDFVVVWADSYYGPDDHDVFAQRFGTTEVPACSPAPLGTCRQQTLERGTFKFTERPNPNSSRLSWVWAKGEQTDHADFGDPFDDTAYVFCVYDASAAPQPVASLLVAPGGFCGSIGCWRQLGGPVGPIQYAKNVSNADGVTQIRLIPGAQGAAKMSLTARGANLSLPGTPLTPPVVVQAQATNDECWSAEYDANIRLNEDGRFSAKPTVP